MEDHLRINYVELEESLYELKQLIERNIGITSTLLGFICESELIDKEKFLEYCSNLDYNTVIKEVERNEKAARSEQDNLHAGGSAATICLCNMAGIDKTKKVLDAGTGHGGAARVIAEQYGCNVVGMEMDYVRLIHAIFRTKQLKLDHLVSYCLGDAYDMPFIDHSYDAVIRQHAVYGQEEDLFLKECYRVLKPGGVIAFQGILKGTSLESRKNQMEDYSLKDYCGLLTSIGFTNIVCESEKSTYELQESFRKTNPLMCRLAEKKMILGVKLVASKSFNI